MKLFPSGAIVPDSTNQEVPKPVCFVLMPIADTAGYEAGHFGRVYEHLLKPAIIEAGYLPVRADDTVKTDYIVVGIIQKIVESAMVLCDYSSRNPNVMYELGIRHAFNKPVVLIKDRQTEKIFDIQGLRYTEYDETLRIDAVNKDRLKIKDAIKETSTASERDLNSIVKLAGIKTAEVPAGQTISSDTTLILSAIAALERRVEEVEETPVNRKIVCNDDAIMFPDGSVGKVGGALFRNGKAIGTIAAIHQANRRILMSAPNGDQRSVSIDSPNLKDVSCSIFSAS
jgi:hypothetical protein